MSLTGVCLQAGASEVRTRKRNTALQLQFVTLLLASLVSGCEATVSITNSLPASTASPLPIAAPDTVAPIVTVFTVPTTSTSLAVSGINLQASDDIGVAAFYLSDVAATPSADASGWLVVAPRTFTFSNSGIRTLYAWAKDAAGNVSNAASATVTITLPDITAPTITSFVIPATATSTTVPISALTATDNVGVTGYLISENANSPYSSDTGWGSTPAASYTFSGLGQGIPTVRTLYAWAKDAAGNVSNSSTAKVTITLPTGVPGSALLQQENLVYEGAFRVPAGDFGSPQYTGFNYGGIAPAYNAANNSLFLGGHLNYRLSAEVSIPPLVNSANLTALNTASVLQNFADLTEGNYDKINAGGAVFTGSQILSGGLLVYDNKLIGTIYAYFDGLPQAALSHFTSGLNLAATGDFAGMYQVGTSAQVPLAGAGGAGFVGGYMATIPAEYQAALGGPVLTGQTTYTTVNRSSYGPGAFAFDPARLGIDNPVNTTPLLYYSSGHRTLGEWLSGGNQYMTSADFITGVVFPEGSRSVLFFGRHGTPGTDCYGPGTATQSQAMTNAGLKAWFSLNPTATYTCGVSTMPASEAAIGDGCCYDPTGLGSKGTHSYPYVYQVWAYDAEDFAKVKSGAINPNTSLPYQPWDIVPYAVWTFNLPFAPDNHKLGGVAYDPASQLIYVAQEFGDSNRPVIHVFKVSLQ